jgi:AcrR family transcriptional regulator
MNPLSIDARKSVLDPTIPVDIGVLSQRQRIIDAMIESCAEKTYAATTIADIVRHASISRTTFYKRFSGKRECFEAALDFCIDEIRDAAASSHTDSDSPPEAVRKAAAAILELLAARPALAQMMASEAVSVEPAVSVRYGELLVPALENLWDDSEGSRHPHTDPRLAISRGQLLVYNQIAAGHTEELPELLPETVYLSLLPFVGHEEALEQARLAAREAGSNASASLGGG